MMTCCPRSSTFAWSSSWSFWPRPARWCRRFNEHFGALISSWKGEISASGGSYGRWHQYRKWNEANCWWPSENSHTWDVRACDALDDVGILIAERARHCKQRILAGYAHEQSCSHARSASLQEQRNVLWESRQVLDVPVHWFQWMVGHWSSIKSWFQKFQMNPFWQTSFFKWVAKKAIAIVSSYITNQLTMSLTFSPGKTLPRIFRVILQVGSWTFPSPTWTDANFSDANLIVSPFYHPQPPS